MIDHCESDPRRMTRIMVRRLERVELSVSPVHHREVIRPPNGPRPNQDLSPRPKHPTLMPPELAKTAERQNESKTGE